MKHSLMKTVILLFLIPSISFAAIETKYIIGVNGLTCPFCAYGLEKKLKKVKGVQSVTIDLEKDRVVLIAKSGETIEEESLRKAVRDAGFTVASLEKVETDTESRHTQR